MTVLPVTLVTASLLAVFYVVLSVAVSAQRGRTKVGLGTGSDASVALGQEHTASPLLVAVRRHAHFAEYVPLSLILLALLELAGVSRTVLVALAAALVLARLMIALGMGRPAPNVLRAGGNVIQLLVILVSAAFGLWTVIATWG
jgi:uncharacterized protein